MNRIRFGLVATAVWLLVAAASAAAHPPYGLVADPAGNAYFSDLETVWRLRADGGLEIFRPADGTHVHELQMGPDGAVEGEVNRYEPATRAYRAGLWRRSPDGRESWAMPETASPPKGSGLWRDRKGNRYLAQWVSQDDRRTMLFRRSPAGRLDLLYGPRREAASFRQVVASSVGAMAFPADGSVVFADGRALRRVARDGRPTTLFEGPEETVLRGVAAMPDGRVLVADAGGARILAIAADGRARTLYTSGRGWIANAATLRRGRLLVLEANARPYDYDDRVRVVEVGPDRRARVVALPARGPTASPAAAGPRRRWRAPMAAAAAATAIAIALVLTLRARRV